MPFNNEQETGVGYGKPPVQTQFRKGQSGNPKGRPKGRLNVATVLEKALHEKVVINENGRRRTITKLEAAMKQLVNKAASGDLPSLRQLSAMARAAEEQAAAATTKSAGNQSAEELSEVDAKVLEGILKRFAEDQQAEGEANVDAQ
ncbi:MAG: DUF5681 domain-containing protein [Terriglobales bacterium]